MSAAPLPWRGAPGVCGRYATTGPQSNPFAFKVARPVTAMVSWSTVLLQDKNPREGASAALVSKAGNEFEICVLVPHPVVFKPCGKDAVTIAIDG